MEGRKLSKKDFMQSCLESGGDNSNSESDDDSDIQVTSSEFSEDESEADDYNEDVAREGNAATNYTARDGTVWTEDDAAPVGEAQSLFKGAPGPTSSAKGNITERKRSAWDLMITAGMLKHMKKCTEAEALRRGEEGWKVSLEELGKFIGVLYARGVCGCRALPIHSLWSVKWGPPFFRKSISRDRFKEIMKYMRFDLKSSRSERLKRNKFALVSEIWDKFTENCTACYNPGECVAIDEQLYPTKTRCRFTQYMPRKPDKFGIKFWVAVDTKSKYILNAKPYLGKDDHRPEGLTVGEHVVLTLAQPFFKMGRNIVTDNFFTSLKLAKMLRKERTSLVGSLRCNRPELPSCASDTKPKLFSSKILVHEGVILTVYRCRRKRNATVLSTQHKSVTFNAENKLKPSTVEYYNAHKCGADSLDQMVRKYSVRGGSRRWPMQVLYNILDLAAVNAWILYKETLNSRISRREFILGLCEELSNLSGEEAAPATEARRACKRKRCQIGLCKKNNSSDTCTKCQKVVCGSCARYIEKRNIVICKKC